MFKLFEKIKQSRIALVEWSKAIFGNSKTKLQVLQAELEDLSLQNNANNAQRISTLKSEINTILHHDDLFWRQRSRSIWLPAGDKNTKFFHQRESQRRRKNHIPGLQDTDGGWYTLDEQIAHVAEQYFKELFTTTNPTDMGSVLYVMDRCVTPHMNNALLQRYTPDEVKWALFQMHPSKSLGPDGNVVSRILPKVLANRLKTILPTIISEAQSAFIPNRLITDNTTVAYELLHRMQNKRNGKVGQMAGEA
ncbi:uncharacterized protein LOC142625123 [Castanea sativa]|uniref:uncharacterized protein LOC142625123 n=1 Tax=Castanea sativa TaxID=21020 RepID=UPI003F651957